MVWFRKQGPALAFDDAHPNHLVIAEDISRHGHKRYGCCPHSEVDSFIGPYNELIRTHSVCRLYFDLDGGPENLPGIVQGIIAQVCTRVYNTYNNRVDPATVIVLCASNTVTYLSHSTVSKQLVPHAQLCSYDQSPTARPFCV